MAFYLIETKLQAWPAHEDASWLREHRKQWAPPCCHYIQDRPLEIRLAELGDDLPLNFAYGSGLTLIRGDLRRALGMRSTKTLRFGNVFDADDVRISDVKAVESSNAVQLRGNRNSTHQFCKTCGQFLYCAYPPFYVLEADLPRRSIELTTLEATLICSEKGITKLNAGNIRGLRIRELPVLEEPRDGLPVDLMSVRPKSLRGR